MFIRAIAVPAVVLLIAAVASASETKVQLKDLPAAVQKTVREQSSGATLRGLTRETENGRTTYEAELLVNGHTRDVTIDAAGAVVEIEAEVSLDSLPAPLKAAILKRAGAGKVLGVESITRKSSVVAYEARIKTGLKTAEVSFSPDGALMN